MADGMGKRYNSGKPRYDLIPAIATDEFAKVLTVGAEKYGPHNWCRGMPWSYVLASLERHLYAIKRGEDYDKETELLHAAHIMCNAAFLVDFYTTYPQGDDRRFVQIPKIAIEIDVLKDAHENAIIPADEMKFVPECYFTYLDTENYVIDWLNLGKYPAADVCEFNAQNITFYKDFMINEAKVRGIQIIIVMNYSLFVELSKSDVFCYLMTTEKNKIHNVGHRRLYNLNSFA